MLDNLRLWLLNWLINLWWLYARLLGKLQTVHLLASLPLVFPNTFNDKLNYDS